MYGLENKVPCGRIIKITPGHYPNFKTIHPTGFILFDNVAASKFYSDKCVDCPKRSNLDIFSFSDFQCTGFNAQHGAQMRIPDSEE